VIFVQVAHVMSWDAPAYACSADHPVCRRPARQGAGRAKPVKMQRPAGRTILTGLAWSAGLAPRSMADGMIRHSPQPATYGGGALEIIRSRSASPEGAVLQTIGVHELAGASDQHRRGRLRGPVGRRSHTYPMPSPPRPLRPELRRGTARGQRSSWARPSARAARGARCRQAFPQRTLPL
jgi:hypothetical protein